MNEEKDLMERIYRRFLKGEIIERELAYRTAKGRILDKLKMNFDLFIKRLVEDQDEWREIQNQNRW